MASKNLREFAASLGFENKNNRFFGDYHSYSITLTEGGGRKNLMIGIALPRDDSRLDQIVGFIENNKKESKIVSYSVHPSHLIISVQDIKGVIDRLKKLMDDSITMLQGMGIPGNTQCWYCNGMLTGGAEKVQINDAVVTMHSGCVESFSQNVEQAAEEFHKEQKNYGRGFVGALLGGLIGAIPWVIVYLLGYIAALAGILIGFTTKKGYELMGGKPGKAKVWIVVFVVIVAVFVGQYIAVHIEIYNIIQEEFDDVTFSDVRDFFAFAMEMPDVSREFYTNLAMGLLFALAGCFGIFSELKKEGTGNIATVKRLS